MTQPPYPGPWQPGHPQPYGYPHPPGQPQWQYPIVPPPGLPPASSVRAYAIGVVVTAALVTLCEWGKAIAAWPAGHAFADEVASGGRVEDVITVYDVMMLPIFVALTGAYVATCLWLSQARVNAENLAPTARHARGRAWTWGSWIVPVVSLWFPYQVVRDVWRASTTRSPAGLIGWWWALWLGYTLTWTLGGELPYAMGEDGLRWLGAIETGRALLTTVALVLWLCVVRGISRAQDQIEARMAALRARQWDAYYGGRPIPAHADGAPPPQPPAIPPGPPTGAW